MLNQITKAMKKSLKTIFFLLLATSLVFTGCKKSELSDDSISNKDNVLKSVNCGSTTTGILYDYWDDQNTPYGSVEVGNDATNLYVTYTLSPGWTLLPSGVEYYDGCYLFVGSESELGPDDVIYDPNTGHFNFRDFPYLFSTTTSGLTTYQFTIPRSEITLNCPMIVAFAGITDGNVNKYVSARSMFKGMGYWFTHCMQACNHETAYAFGGINPGGANATECFLNIPNIASNNWGWTNQISAGVYDWPIYAGAGQCDLSKGTMVGTLHVDYAPPTATITYNLLPGKSLDETHLWVGTDKLPKNKKGQYITAPG